MNGGPVSDAGFTSEGKGERNVLSADHVFLSHSFGGLLSGVHARALQPTAETLEPFSLG